jgi:hypothetical protein
VCAGSVLPFAGNSVDFACLLDGSVCKGFFWLIEVMLAGGLFALKESSREVGRRVIYVPG